VEWGTGYQNASSESLTVVNMKVNVFWDVTSCSLVYCYQGLEDPDAHIFVLEVYSSTLKIEAGRSFEVMVKVY
jgi:hypothetical protein